MSPFQVWEREATAKIRGRRFAPIASLAWLPVACFQDRPLREFADGTSMNNLLVSIADAMGVTPTAKDSSGKTLTNVFGDPAFCTGPLSGLTA